MDVVEEVHFHCTRCGERLWGPVRWLEYNGHTCTYHDPDRDPQPDVHSLGLFAFGPTCARRVLQEQRCTSS